MYVYFYASETHISINAKGKSMNHKEKNKSICLPKKEHLHVI